ncbi:hypothetical protein PCANC_07718 [Puccinia coronata f. sp. avenae]|nr:hypothetical protein PCANC_15974 [Puccinia coronata f. sp. avenae]PLW52532.1 hypothetical protein PCANC_07718 [Puccinia coronata f. sp. avenae]
MPASIKSHRTRSSTYGIKLSLPLPDLKDSPSNRELSSYLRPESSQKAGSYLLSEISRGSGSYLLAASSWAAGSYLIGESSRDADRLRGTLFLFQSHIHPLHDLFILNHQGVGAIGKQEASCSPRAIGKQVATRSPRALGKQVATRSPRALGKQVASSHRELSGSR